MEKNLQGLCCQWLHAPLLLLRLTILIGKLEDKEKYFDNLLVHHIHFFHYHSPAVEEINEAWGMVHKKPKRISQYCLSNSLDISTSYTPIQLIQTRVYIEVEPRVMHAQHSHIATSIPQGHSDLDLAVNKKYEDNEDK